MYLKVWDSENHYDIYAMSVKSIEEAEAYFGNAYKVEEYHG
jgi:hypothetical protein